MNANQTQSYPITVRLANHSALYQHMKAPNNLSILQYQQLITARQNQLFIILGNARQFADQTTSRITIRSPD